MYYFEEVKVLPLQGQGNAVSGERIDVLIFVGDYYCYISALPVPLSASPQGCMVLPVTTSAAFNTFKEQVY